MTEKSRKVKAIESYKERETAARMSPNSVLDINKYQKELLSLYEATYNKIYVMLNDYHTEIDYPTYAKITQLLKEIAEELDAFNQKANKYLDNALKQISRYATKTAIEDMKLTGALKNKESWHYENNYNYIQQMVSDKYKHIAAQTDKMKIDVKNMLIAEATNVFRRASVEGITRKEAYNLLKSSLANKPDFVFVDKKGRKWDTSEYLNMLTRTVLMNGLRESYVNSLAAEGHDLVKISIHGAKDACRSWEGKIISLTGYTKGYPTYDELKASGEIFHPRCRHVLVAYHPTIEQLKELYSRNL